MAPRSEPRLLVLHGLRLEGLAGADAVATRAEMPLDAVERWLHQLTTEGLVVHRDRGVEGWSLTPAGRAGHGRLVAAEVDAAGVRSTIADAYERFRALNPGVLDACSRWQVRDIGGAAVRNDHRDTGYDARVIADLAALHRRAEPVCGELARALDRYRSYGPRLAHALARVQAGERDWLAQPRMPSYHTAWFELHEDLLTTLGLDRTAEAPAAVSIAGTDLRSAAAKGAS